MWKKSSTVGMEVLGGGLALVGIASVFVALYFVVPAHVLAVRTSTGLGISRNHILLVLAASVVCEGCFIVKGRVDRRLGMVERVDTEDHDLQGFLDEPKPPTQVMIKQRASPEQGAVDKRFRVTSDGRPKVPGSRYDRKYFWAEAGSRSDTRTPRQTQKSGLRKTDARLPIAPPSAPAVVRDRQLASDLPSYWSDLSQLAMERDNHRCGNCGSEVDLLVHHIIPLSLGGSNELGNLRTLCRSCHARLHPHMRDA